MTTPHLVFGAGGIGHTEKSFTFTWETPEAVSELLDKLKSLDVLQLDSSASYPPGNPWHTETLLGKANAVRKGFIIDTKILKYGGLNDENITSSVEKSLNLLGSEKIGILYAHQPDPDTPLEETAGAMHKQFLAGKFGRLGLSNYDVEQMARYFEICEAKGFVKPTVYQGHYNAFIRGHEETLIPLLRKHGVAYYAFSPLGGGFLTGKVTFGTEPLTRTRFEGESKQHYFVNTFDKPEVHDKIRTLNATCREFGLSLTEVCLRWLMYHSSLGNEDAIILGAKRLHQLEANVKYCRKGPLRVALVNAVESVSSEGLMHEGDWA